MRSSLFAIAALAALASARSSSKPHHHGHQHYVPPFAWRDRAGYQNGTFQQLLDHSDPSLGTFEQTFYYDTQYWGGPGSPIVMFAPQEVAADEYLDVLDNSTVTGLLAEKIGAATVLMEHRYWGTSSPYDELTTANMKYLTLNNSILDTTYFARNVKLPFDPYGSTADVVPWVLVGGSYSGALTAWVEAKAPGTFWAYLASSAVVQAISDFYGYFSQVQAGMPTNCSTDVTRVIDYMDSVLTTGSAENITALKTKFGLESVEHNDDFMSVLVNGPDLWQGNSFVDNSGFYTWCDYIEGSVNQTDASLLPGADGVGLEKALDGYAAWIQGLVPGYCESYGYFSGTYNTECFDTYNASNPIFTDVSVGNAADRQWEWYLCNQPFGWWQTGAPNGTATIVSRLVDAEYFIRQCGLYFPTGPQGQTYGINTGSTEAEVNAYTGGWEIINTTRLIYTNGQYDPWRDATVSSLWRPDGPLASTAEVPVHIVPHGYHCTDLGTANGLVNEPCQEIIDAEVSQLEQWVYEFPGW